MRYAETDDWEKMYVGEPHPPLLERLASHMIS